MEREKTNFGGIRHLFYYFILDDKNPTIKLCILPSLSTTLPLSLSFVSPKFFCLFFFGFFIIHFDPLVDALVKCWEIFRMMYLSTYEHLTLFYFSSFLKWSIVINMCSRLIYISIYYYWFVHVSWYREKSV